MARWSPAQVRTLSLISTFVSLLVWRVRSDEPVTWAAFLFLAGLVATCAIYGRAFRSWTSSIVPDGGVAYELLTGYLIVSTTLFVLTLATPLTSGPRAIVVCAGAAALLALSTALGRRDDARPHDETGSLSCILLAVVAATLWTRDMQPVAVPSGAETTFRAWPDIFIHVREIGVFAQAHGLETVSDIRLAGASAPIYHFASYMIPAMLVSLTDTSAMTAFSALQLPIGIVLAGLGGYALARVFFGPGPSVTAAAVVMMCPDPYQQGIGIELLGYHFMSQVNLGTLYGIACICIGWAFVVEGCRRDRLWGVAVGWAILGVCLLFKAHIFIANALPMLIYPCIFYKRAPAFRRLVVAMLFLGIFVAVIVASQRIDRVPLVRLDGSGLLPYANQLLDASESSPMKWRLQDLIATAKHARWIAGLGAASMIVLATFGLWIFLLPIVLWRLRKRAHAHTDTVAFPLLITANYVLMATGLALDDRAVGQPEELVNRPFAWAYFVAVLWSTAAAAQLISASSLGKGRSRVVFAAVAGALVVSTALLARNLQVFPAWGFTSYRVFNAVPTCYADAGRYIRSHATKTDVILDDRGDSRFVLTAIAERQAYFVDAAFGGPSPLDAGRRAEMRSLASLDDGDAIVARMRALAIAWYLMSPGRAGVALAPDLIAYACGGYSLVHVAR